MDILRTPQILLISLVAGWLNGQQQDIINYLLEEIRHLPIVELKSAA